MSTAITTTIPVEVTGLSKAEHDVLDAIMLHIKTSLDGIRRAARLWADLSAKAKTRIVEQTRPNLRDFWVKLEAVGSGALHPQLATVSGLAARFLGKLPLEQQERYLRDGMEVVEVKGRKHDVRLVDVVDLDEFQRRLVFKIGKDGAVSVRTIEEQKTLLADQAAKRLLQEEAKSGLKRVERVGWTIEKGRVWLKPNRVESGLTKRDLETMLRDLEG